jgi:hypothetical protein
MLLEHAGEDYLGTIEQLSIDAARESASSVLRRRLTGLSK